MKRRRSGVSDVSSKSPYSAVPAVSAAPELMTRKQQSIQQDWTGEAHNVKLKRKSSSDPVSETSASKRRKPSTPMKVAVEAEAETDKEEVPSDVLEAPNESAIKAAQKQTEIQNSKEVAVSPSRQFLDILSPSNSRIPRSISRQHKNDVQPIHYNSISKRPEFDKTMLTPAAKPALALPTTHQSLTKSSSKARKQTSTSASKMNSFPSTSTTSPRASRAENPANNHSSSVLLIIALAALIIAKYTLFPSITTTATHSLGTRSAFLIAPFGIGQWLALKTGLGAMRSGKNDDITLLEASDVGYLDENTLLSKVAVMGEMVGDISIRLDQDIGLQDRNATLEGIGARVGALESAGFALENELMDSVLSMSGARDALNSIEEINQIRAQNATNERFAAQQKLLNSLIDQSAIGLQGLYDEFTLFASELHEKLKKAIDGINSVSTSIPGSPDSAGSAQDADDEAASSPELKLMHAIELLKKHL